MYTKDEYDSMFASPLHRIVGPMTVALVVASPGGQEQVTNPATAMGFLDGAVMLLHTNGVPVEDIKQIVLEQAARVDAVIAQIDKMKQQGREKLAALREQYRASQERIGQEVSDAELGPAPQLASAAPDASQVEWPTRES